MTPDRRQQIDRLFRAASAYEPSRRDEFLAAHCAGDDSLRFAVESLIASHEDAQGFNESLWPDLAPKLSGGPESTFAPGEQDQSENADVQAKTSEPTNAYQAFQARQNSVRRSNRITPERWQQVDQLFHEALVRAATERREYLAAHCDGDESLRAEVESLISSHEEAPGFIETGVGDVAAELLRAHESTFKAGEQIGNYTIVRQLGSGGMAIVYLVDDNRLNRKVALKLLPPHFTVNPDRVRRFEREARAASALNHPNIVTIYEIGQSNSTHFIATEFVDGKTVRELMNEKPFTLSEALNVAIQIGEALAAAHGAGIVHRDIKPENIMVRVDGYVKVLDFGLAKLTEPQSAESDLETATLLQSNPGLVMGTVQYMSPEQARARRVDARTDIWSLGIVLYELLSGHVPFSGETLSHVMVSLMEDQLPPVARYANVPAKLDRIVTKALRKHQKERYQTASKLARDLKALKHELQVEKHLQGVLETVPSSKAGEYGARAAVANAATTKTNALPSNASLSHDRLASTSRVSGKRRALVVFAALIITAGLVWGVSKLARRNRSVETSTAPFQTFELTRLTNSGKVNDAAISVDGKYVAYVAEQDGMESIWLRDILSSHDTQVVPPADITYYGGTFSRDGNDLYYIAMERTNSIGVLHRVPVRGGAPVKLIVDVDGPVSLSPDNKQIAFVRGSSTGERALMISSADGSVERKLASRTGYDAFTFNGPAWSPDGLSIACGAAYSDQTGRSVKLVAVSVMDGSIRELAANNWKTLGRISWLQDASGLIFTAPTDSSAFQLWFLPYPNGKPQRITRDLHDYHGVSVTGDSRILVAKQTQTISNLAIAPKDRTDLAKSIFSHKADANYDPYEYSRTRFFWASNGKIVYTSAVNGSPNIWTMNVQGTDKKQLTNDPGVNTFPSMTPDGRHIIFISSRTGFSNVWRMDTDGRNQTRLTSGEDESWAWCSPDNRWIIYHSGKQGKRTLWRVPIEGGTPEQLTDYPSVCPAVSPDGKWILSYYRIEMKAPWKIAIIPINGGYPIKTLDVPQGVEFRSLIRWTPDGLSIAYIANRDGVSNIWTQPLAAEPARRLTHFTSDKVLWFDWSPDGQQFGVTRGAFTSDVVMIKDLQRMLEHSR